MIARNVDDVFLGNSFSGKRRWYFKDFKKSKVGTLSLSDDSTTLLFSMQRSLLEDYKNVKQITTSKKSSRIALLESTVWETPMAGFFSKHETVDVYAKPWLVAIQPFRADAIRETVTEISAHLPGVGEWFDINFLDFDKNNFQFKNRKTIYHKIPLGKYATIFLKATLEVEHTNSDGKFTATQESYASIEFSQPMNIRHALNVFDHVESFFNFIFSVPNSAYVFESPAPDKWFKFIIAPYRKAGARVEREYGNRLLFKFDDAAKTDINKVFVKWALEYDRIQEVVEVITLLKTSKVSEELRFTTLINALESVHRRYFNGAIQPEDEFKARLETILGQISDSDDKKLVGDKLQYANELNLRKRLKQLTVLAANFGVEKIDDATVMKIVDTRNYLTHGDERLKSKILTPAGLYKVNGALGRSLKAMILFIIGFDEIDLKNIVARSDQFATYYRDQPKEEKPYYL